MRAQTCHPDYTVFFERLQEAGVRPVAAVPFRMAEAGGVGNRTRAHDVTGLRPHQRRPQPRQLSRPPT
jgi:hypothetical protein